MTASVGNSSQSGKLRFSRDMEDESEPFRGKSGSVSFMGLTHQSVERSKPVSAPFEENSGSIVWILAPVALLSSFVLPKFFIAAVIEELFENEVHLEIVSTFISEVSFYIGLAIFVWITDHVQKPYLEFSAKRWSLITGLRGYFISSFFTMGVKVYLPVYLVCCFWSEFRIPAIVAVAPLLVGCLIQLVFEKVLEIRNSSSWPLVPILFEVYRISQLTRAAIFVQKLMYTMKDVPMGQQAMEIRSASVAMIIGFQILGVVSLWSLLSFLMRLFPSRPVSRNY